MSARSRRRQERRIAAAVAHAEKHPGVHHESVSSVAPQVLGTRGADRDPPLHNNPKGGANPRLTSHVGASAAGLPEAPATPCDAPNPVLRRGSPHGLTHGLHSREVVIPGEDPAAFESYRAAVLDEMRPVGIREADLAETLVMAQWKLRRLWRGETQVCERSQAAVMLVAFDGPRRYAAFTGHEAHLMRAYLRAEARLRLLQDLRRKGLGADVADRARSSAPTNEPQLPLSSIASNRVNLPSAPSASAAGLPEAWATPCDPPNTGEPEPPPVASGPEFPISHCSAAPIGEIPNRPPGPHLARGAPP